MCPKGYNRVFTVDTYCELLGGTILTHTLVLKFHDMKLKGKSCNFIATQLHHANSTTTRMGAKSRWCGLNGLTQWQCRGTADFKVHIACLKVLRLKGGQGRLPKVRVS